MHENTLLDSLTALFRTDDASVAVGVGPDDCAHVIAGGRRISLSTDVFAEGSHFTAGADPALVAEKAVAASVSDLAASACRARWLLVGLCLRKNSPPDWAERFAVGVASAARKWGVAVVGGDTVSSSSSTFVSTTVAGEPLPGGPVLRGGGHPGDILIATGAFGGSMLGRHLRPRPRVREIAELMKVCADAQVPVPAACMDVSDGLALDLSRLCRESGTGAVLEAGLIPIAQDAFTLAARTGKTPLSHALGDGEDFELLIALPPETWEALQAQADATAKAFTRIGRLTEKKSGLRLQSPDGALSPLAAEGFEHTW